MLKYNKYLVLLAAAFIFPARSFAQNCSNAVWGAVKDVNTGNPVAAANIYIKESASRAVSDSLGFFRIDSLCSGAYHITISQVDCEPEELYLYLSRDTGLTVYLNQDFQLLDGVSFVEKNDKNTSQAIQSLNSKTIAQNADKSLANMLESISGVSVIKNGNGITKPVVHGLYGNRLTILNNGITQSGQQWGVDHSPEIDPLVANSITVIKGVNALEYQGSSLGSVILVEPRKINNEPHLHGEGRYFFESNGLGNGLNISMHQHSKYLAWRVVGTLKKSGDKRSSKYYLRNTGNQEANIALQLEKKWNSQWFSEVYFSSFNAELGVLRGSHIGNLTDLRAALERDVPFFTEDRFSYALASPYQKVNHHLFKFHTKYYISNTQWMDFTYAGQYNIRKEFDVRRSGRSDMPALSLNQLSNFLEAKYQHFLPNNWEFKSGIQVNLIDNTNIPETGILPLIPDYFAFETGLFGMISKEWQKTKIEMGVRYDFKQRNVAAISVTIPRTIIRYDNNFHNMSGMAGVTRDIGTAWQASYNIGVSARNPEVNELYSNGLHQGVSGIEEGSPDLKKETSVKNTLAVTGKITERWSIEGLFYYQHIENYIFLKPQNEIRYTIRGAFPVFKYEQTGARLSGLDLATTYKLMKSFNVVGKYSYIKGYDRSNQLPLVYMPSNNLYMAFNYQIPKAGYFQNLEFQINNRYVFEQKALLESQDFVAPPKSYNLVGLKFSAERQMKNFKLYMFLKAENLLNTTYRDYLNRQRYFADDLGVNLVAGFNISF